MSTANVLVNFDGLTQFKVKNGETFTVPNVITSPSPTGQASGVYPTTTFDAKKEVSYCQLYATFNDGAGPTDLGFPGLNLRPNDVLVLSAVVSNVITATVNGVTVFTITGVTTTGGVLGCYA